MTDFNALVADYLAVWNEPDQHARTKAVSRLWTEDATYTDPLIAAVGHHAIAAFIAGVRERFPEHEFRPLGTVDGHHDIARFRWELFPPGADESLAAGFDVAVITEDGRIRAVHGFLDKVPG